jgi:hypothetical protein
VSQNLRGFVGQGMRQQKLNKHLQEPFSFPGQHLSYAFTPPRAGYWKFVLWGPGGAGVPGVAGGASGAYAEITRFLTPAQTVTIVAGEPFTGSAAIDTTVTFPDGSTIIAGAASGAVAGVPSGGDFGFTGTAGVNGNGNPGAGTGGGSGGAGTGSSSGGAGAPGRLPYRGGTGAGLSGGTTVFAGPGGGGLETPINAGPGHVLAVYIRA